MKTILVLLLLIGSSAEAKKSRKSVRYSYDRTRQAQKVSEFWKAHKVGMGLQGAGRYGVLGTEVELRFHPSWSAGLGFGGSGHFQAFAFQAKHSMMMSSPFNPYVSAGLSIWQRNNRNPFNESEITPTFLVKKFMSAEDRANYRIDEQLLTAAIGLQYTLTGGMLSGLSFNAELVFLTDYEDFELVPTGSAGVFYYF